MKKELYLRSKKNCFDSTKNWGKMVKKLYKIYKFFTKKPFFPSLKCDIKKTGEKW